MDILSYLKTFREGMEVVLEFDGFTKTRRVAKRKILKGYLILDNGWKLRIKDGELEPGDGVPSGRVKLPVKK